MNDLRVKNPDFPTSMKGVLMWGAGIAAATWLSWHVTKALERYEQLKKVHTGYPYTETPSS